MTPTDRFGAILAAIGIVASVLGWMVRSLWRTQTDATKANTEAVNNLTTVVGDLAQRLARVEGATSRKR